MKAIPEEYLIERLEESIESCRFGDAEVIQAIIDDLEEIDTLTVSRLRPMEDAPKDSQILVVYDNEFVCVEWDYQYKNWKIDDEYSYKDGVLKGWIPMPIYKPEKE